jgi:zinc protease
VKNRFLILLLLPLAACNVDHDEAAKSLHEGIDSPSLPAGITLVEQFAGDDSGISIPYAKYELDNGLTLVLHEDHSDPIVHVDVTYHVGSNREEIGRSGFAHLFEHMMFQGSKNVADGELAKIVTDSGGTRNGTTNNDRTNYFETMPSNYLETALWLEADRMGLLLDAIDQEKFEIQRETVKNERGFRIDNVPYGRIGEVLDKAMYSNDHPYSWPVIGWMEDLDAAEVSDLKRFFLRWYGPNNAVLTIGGDIDTEWTLALVSQYFASIPTGPEVENLPKQPATLDADRYITMEDNIHLPAIAMLVPTVYAGHEDEAALDTAADILGGSEASLLYQRLVQTGRAVQIVVGHGCRELACAMNFIVVQNPGSGETLTEMEAAIRETIQEFSEREVNADDLQKFKAQYEAGRIFGLQSVAGKVSTLAAFETYRGTPAGIAEEIDQYLSVSTEDVTRVFDQYINKGHSVILSIVPNGATQLAATEPDFVPPEREIPESYGDEDAELPLRPVVDNFDRSEKPVAGASPTVELPAIWDTTLANGVRLLAVTNTETPTITISAVFDVGQRDEPPGKAGIAALTTALMQESTAGMTTAEFSEELNRIGATVGVNSGGYQTSVTLNTLSKHLDKAVQLMLDRALRPDFTQDDFDRAKAQTMEGLMHQRKSPQALAGRALNSALYGPEHVLAYPGSGLPSTVESITLEEVKAFYQAHFPQHFSGVLVSTSLPQEDIIIALQGFAEIEVAEAFREPVPAGVEISGRRIYLVNKDGAAQSSVRTAHHSLKYDALGDYYKSRLMNFAMGGTSSSRIYLNLREDKGYTYGASTGFNGGRELGRFGFSSEINKDSTGAALKELFSELEHYNAEGMTEEEYQFMQNAIGQSEARQYETPGNKLRLLGNILRYDLPLNYRTLQKNLLKETDRENLNALAAELLHPDDMVIVVVGDLAVIRPELEALEIPITVLNEDGYVLEEE